jgi:hypothetical protein
MHALLWILLLAQTQGGVISGRIVSVDGSPAAQKRVVAQAVLERADVALGASMLAGLTQTDNDGRFRLENIPPGRYYIVLDPLDVPSYYPGVTKPDRATIVTVSDASVIEGMDFKIPDFDGGKVYGRLDPPPRPLTGAVMVNMVTNPNLAGLTSLNALQAFTLNLLSSTGTNVNIAGALTSLSSSPAVSVPVKADGTFEFPKTRAGSYILLTSPGIGLSTRTVEIDGVDLRDVELIAGTATAVARGVTVRGHIAGNPVPELMDGLTVALTDRSITGAPRVPVNPDGSFTFTNVQPGSYVAITIPSPNVDKRTAVQVGSQDIDDIQVVPPATIEIPGRIDIEGGGNLKSLSVPMTIEAYHLPLSTPLFVVQPGASFSMHVLEGENRILLRNVPSDYSVVSMTYGKTDLLRNPLVPDPANAGDIRIVLAPIPSGALHRVRGQVDGLPSVGIGPSAKIVLYGAGSVPRVAETPLKSDGTFEFPGVPSDSYYASVAGAPFDSQWMFDVGSEDREGIRMKGEIWSDVSGHVTIVDRNGTILPGFPFSYMTVVFSPSVPWGTAPVRQDGTFRQSLSGGEYSLITNRLPDGYTLKAVTAGAGGPDLLRGKLRIDGRPIPEITVTLEYRPKTTP